MIVCQVEAYSICSVVELQHSLDPTIADTKRSPPPWFGQSLAMSEVSVSVALGDHGGRGHLTKLLIHPCSLTALTTWPGAVHDSAREQVPRPLRDDGGHGGNHQEDSGDSLRH